MEQYIKKTALVAEIEKLYNGEIDTYTRNILDRLKSNIDTIEVREAEDSTAAGMAEEIIVNLKRVENDYNIDLTKQMEWLRNIVKKGK